MSIKIQFKGGMAFIQGDGKENLPFNEHELIDRMTMIIGGAIVEDKSLETDHNSLPLTTGRT